METAPYTCNSCLVAFRTSEAQRTHMRSDWHRYNLKRRIATLPPISSEIFTDKIVSAQATSSATAAKASFQRSCQTCQKNYFSENAYQDHLGSRKHKIRVIAASKEKARDAQPSSSTTALSEKAKGTTSPSEKLGPEAAAEFEQVVNGLKDASISESDPLSRGSSHPHYSASETTLGEAPPVQRVPQDPKTENVPSTSEIEAPLTKCIFCNYNSPTWKLNVSHMSKIHGLFIPEPDYLVDQEGLIRSLQAKVHGRHECLLCHKLKGTTSGVQTHMRDKGHCMIAFETEEEMIEVGQFYDFTSTYSDDASEDTDMIQASESGTNGGVRLPNSIEKEVEDEGWETDSSFSSLDSADSACIPVDDRSHQYMRLPLHRHHSHHDPRPHRNIDGFHSRAHHTGINAVFHDEVELHLPSGRTAGHRNFRKYYRQNLHSYPTASEKTEKSRKLLEQGQDGDVDMVDASQSFPHTPGSQALTQRSEMGLLGATDSQRRELRTSELKGRRQERVANSRYQAKVEKQNNSQKHFRDPLLQ